MENPDTPDKTHLVRALAEAIDLPIPDEYLAGVVNNFEAIRQIARLVTEFEIPEGEENDLTFTP